MLDRSVASPPDILFYDGHCALCHRSVKFVLRHDHDDSKFLFAPLQGSTFMEKIPSDRRAALPDSLIVLTSKDELFVRSGAFLHVCRRLGGVWGVLAAIVAIVPRIVRDAAYNLVARTRYRIFGRKEDLCPVVPASLRGRFLN
jgi:predicted DCC family thiol-disulfide oxidoreductase YuxK